MATFGNHRRETFRPNGILVMAGDGRRGREGGEGRSEAHFPCTTVFAVSRVDWRSCEECRSRTRKILINRFLQPRLSFKSLFPRQNNTVEFNVFASTEFDPTSNPFNLCIVAHNPRSKIHAFKTRQRLRDETTNSMNWFKGLKRRRKK